MTRMLINLFGLCVIIALPILILRTTGETNILYFIMVSLNWSIGWAIMIIQYNKKLSSLDYRKTKNRSFLVNGCVFCFIVLSCLTIDMFEELLPANRLRIETLILTTGFIGYAFGTLAERKK